MLERQALKSVPLGEPFGFVLEVHHILLARKVAGGAGIESQSSRSRRGYDSAF